MTSSEPKPLNINRYGLSEVYSPGAANVDVVLVHGLNGDPQSTWTAEKSKVFWPSELLPPIVEEEKARILVYGYDADVTSFTDGTSKDMIHNHAERLVADLFANRRIRRASERPIIFVAHSLGGLVVKRALIYSSEIRGLHTEHLRSIYVSTYGILFLGTPHKGADIAQWGSRLEWICSAVMPSKVIDSAPQLIDALKRNNETLQVIDRQFIQIMGKYHIFFFHEAKPTNLKGTLRYIVDEDSASPTVSDVERAGIQADHSHMCKFENDSAPGFAIVVEGIMRYAEDAPASIKSQWETEREERDAQKKATAKAIYPALGTPQSGSMTTPSSSPGNSTSDLSLTKSVERPRPEPAKTTIDPPEYPPKPSEPYFIVPPGFRSNTFFVGMEKELQNLDKRLFDKRRRAAGTSCVLLHGQAGTGKSHLARQYVYQKRDKFKGGVFWIDARLKEEVYQSFWIIAQKVVARDSPELRSPINSEKKPFVEVVKDWFENRHDWLMVFDGVALDKDEDASQLQQFIPDSTNSSLIYVSRAQNLETKQRLLRPFPIKVSPLKDDDARKLLFKELHIKKPSESDKKRALELVKKMGGLPLAIHAISHRLADTHEPLKNYTMKSYSADPKLGATYNQIMDDLQRGNHMEAWNLINILCFFGPNIPVEMVNMGLSALRFCDVDVESTDGGKPDINITFATLMRYALIERNEPVDSDSSSSRDSLVDPEPIDMLKIHRVVQNFCCDALNAAHLLPRCLEYATSLFIHSFRQADLKIKKRPEPGRVSDYRAYLIHGQKLWDNSLHYENRNQPLNDVRHDLGPWLDNINEEIRLREPSSSQESVENTTVFQTSVFDRASNSSDSLPSDLGMPDQGILTPKHRPTPLPLPHQNPFGIELGKPAMDSPRSIGTNSPTAYPRIVDHSPRAQYPPLYPYYSTGYTSDREDMPRSQPMNQSVSEATARPHVPSIPSHGEDWQVVPSSRKLRKPRYQKNLGNFRPAGATTLLDKDQATGSVTRQAPKSRGELSGSSDAVTSLAAVHHASPPPSRGGGSIWPRRSSSRPAALSIDRPTYAGVLAGETSQPAFSHQGPPNSSTGPHSRAVDTSPIQNWDPSREAFHGPSDDLQMPPLTRATPSTMNEYSQYQPPPATSRLGVAPGSSKSSPGMQHVQSQPGSSTNLSRIALQQSSSENTVPTYHQTLITGPNPAPLPFESDIIISTKRPYPSDSRTAYQRSTSSNQSHSSFSPTFPFTTAIPPGYTSQPTSRNPSHISHLSEPATEPPRPSHPMSFSPHLSSASVSHSPRDRLPDGSSPRKSPRVSYAYPVPPPGHEEYIISPSSQTSGVLSGTGGWAAVPRAFNEHHSPLSQHSPLSRSTSMSRSGSGGGGSRGAGVVVDEDRGLGIAEFGAEVVFGELEPVRLEEARSRTRAWEEELRGRSRDGRIGGGRARSGDAGVPYPDVNLIPTESDRMVLDGMVGERGRR